MGITIILLILSCLLFFLTYQINRKTYHDELAFILLIPAVISAIGVIISIIATLTCLISAPKELSAYQAKSEMYQQAINTISQETSTVDKSTLYLEIIDYNANIIQNREKSNSFWLAGWHSKLWHEVPLVTLPGDISES